MWHEARRQEKKIRGLMVDYKKRAERRREYYEKIKLDPTQFLRIYGRPTKIHLEMAVAIAAEGPQSMMPWQGNPDIMIDRFDVRANLDHIDDRVSCTPVIMTADEEEELRQINYERYRILVQNECAGVTEEQCLQQIYMDEQFGAIESQQSKMMEHEKKKSSKEKAAIGFIYEDSTPVSHPKAPSPEEEEEEEKDILSDDEVDLDMALDVDLLTEEQAQLLNQCSVQYGMVETDYVDALHHDKEEEEALRLAKILEEEKAQFSGRKSRRERRAYKERKLKGRQISPPSYAARESPKYDSVKRGSSSSQSRSPSPQPAGGVLFITSFGGGSSDEGSGVVQGPSLPPHLQSENLTQALREDDKRTSPRPKTKRTNLHRKSHSSASSRSRSRSPQKQWSHVRSGSRSRSRSRSWGKGYRSMQRSRSHSRSRSWGISRRSRSPRRWRSYSRSRSRSRNRRLTRSRTRSRSRSRSRSYSRSSSSRSRSRSYSRSRSRSYSSSRSRSRSRSRSYSRSKSGSRSRSKSHSKSPSGATAIKRYRRDSLSSSSSLNFSEEETEEGQDTAQNPKQKPSTSLTPGKAAKSSSKGCRLTMQERLKRRMQAALNKQYKMDKKAEQDKISKAEQQRLDREEELRALAIQMRKREREKRHKEREDQGTWDEAAEEAGRGKGEDGARGGVRGHFRSSHDKSPARRTSYRKRTHSRSKSRSPARSQRSREHRANFRSDGRHADRAAESRPHGPRDAGREVARVREVGHAPRDQRDPGGRDGCGDGHRASHREAFRGYRSSSSGQGARPKWGQDRSRSPVRARSPRSRPRGEEQLRNSRPPGGLLTN